MDLRKPIGLLFSMIGLILIVWGLIGEKTPFTEGGVLDRNGSNINLIWGGVTFAFGAVMGIFSLVSKQEQ